MVRDDFEDHAGWIGVESCMEGTVVGEVTLVELGGVHVRIFQGWEHKGMDRLEICVWGDS